MKKLIISAALAVFFLLGASEVFACSCVPDDKRSISKKVQTSYQQATAVFYGEVIEIKSESGADRAVDPNASLAVKFRVRSSWKGRAQREVVVKTAGNSAMCGFNFEVGVTYVVYANNTGSGLQTTICSRTSAGNADAKYLNKLKKPRTVLR